MKRIDLKKVLHMDFLIQHRCTGNAVEFAQKLDLFRSALFNYLDYMRNDLGSASCTTDTEKPIATTE